MKHLRSIVENTRSFEQATKVLDRLGKNTGFIPKDSYFLSLTHTVHPDGKVEVKDRGYSSISPAFIKTRYNPKPLKENRIHDLNPHNMADAELSDHIQEMRSKLKKTRGNHKRVVTIQRKGIKKQQQRLKKTRYNQKLVIERAKQIIDKARKVKKNKANLKEDIREGRTLAHFKIYAKQAFRKAPNAVEELGGRLSYKDAIRPALYNKHMNYKDLQPPEHKSEFTIPLNQIKTHQISVSPSLVHKRIEQIHKNGGKQTKPLFLRKDKQGQHWLMDGNHETEALKQYFGKNYKARARLIPYPLKESIMIDESRLSDKVHRIKHLDTLKAIAKNSEHG